MTPAELFQEQVLARDKHRCVICGRPASGALHVLDSRLFADGGHEPDNGVSLCAEHALAAERTAVSCEALRAAAGIGRVVLPAQLPEGEICDRYGSPILPNGLRMRGELHDEPGVQAALAPVLSLFTDRVKYPRTFHLPWSPGVGNDDRVLDDLSAFEGQEVVVTVKMDGECTTLYRDGLHARSIDYEAHPSRSLIKRLHASLAHDIPERFRVCGENVFARHSIGYENLTAHFLVFSIWNERNACLSWRETCEWADLLGLSMVPPLYQGPWDEALVRALFTPRFGGDPCEGYVVRLAQGFSYGQFRRCVAKYVRARHVQTDAHWMRQQVTPNRVRGA